MTPGPPNNQFIKINQSTLIVWKKRKDREMITEEEERGELLVSVGLDCYWDDEAKRVQTAANLRHGWKVRCNNEQQPHSI